VYGRIVTFTATATGRMLAGTVDFRDGGVSLPGCDAVPLVPSGGNYAATCPMAALDVGSHEITAVYSGDGNNAAGTSTVFAHTVGDRGPGEGSAYSLRYVQKAYVAYYGRPADPGGQTYWAARMDAGGQSLDAIIDAFASSPEFANRYGALDGGQLINTFYQQAIGRHADPGGFNFYLGKLQDGSLTKQSIALDIMNGATIPPDSTAVVDKLEVAAYYAARVDLGCPYGTDVGGVDLIAGVTAVSATVADTKAAIDLRCAVAP
jgi:hypothetical protein